MYTHVQDILDIVGHLQSLPGDQDLRKLTFLMHRRAFWKLGFQVKAFLEHWGCSPFEIVEDLMDPILKQSAVWVCSFKVKLSDSQYEVVKKFVEDDYMKVTGQRGYEYWINTSNIQHWIALFKHLWELLEKHLLETTPSHLGSDAAMRRIIPNPPTKASTEIITFVISCLYSLCRVSEHIFSLRVPELQHALRKAGMLRISFFTSTAHDIQRGSQNSGTSKSPAFPSSFSY